MERNTIRWDQKWIFLESGNVGFKSRERDAENGKVSAVESVVRETGGADGNGAQLPIGE